MSSRYFTKRIFKKRPKRGEGSPPKPKAFKTEASANEWAKKQDLKGFKVEQIADKKFKVRQRF
jgi:hypothetical protein